MKIKMFDTCCCQWWDLFDENQFKRDLVWIIFDYTERKGFFFEIIRPTYEQKLSERDRIWIHFHWKKN